MKSTLRVFWLGVLLVFPTPAAAQISPSLAETSAFRVGDHVRLTVWGNPALSGEFEIGEGGMVIHPLYREIQLAGMTLPEAESAFRQIVLRFETNPKLIVEPMFRIAVTGEVRAPNIYTVSPYTTVPEAVAQAGGPTEDAKVSEARLLRNGREIEVDLRLPQTELSNLHLRSGDQIILDRQRHWWRNGVGPALESLGALASITWIILRITNVY
ncbi:MAG TPA: SLBB domain-containing protein [Longimicrobiales bacterium]|nr:SLBB domain-containing protein [Longimicrobiales bacterium]